jgi:hypothetical protein
MDRDFTRYIVFKTKDVYEYLTPAERDQLKSLCEIVTSRRLQANKQPIECVVVESDWPEYEPTWEAITKRVDAETQPRGSVAEESLPYVGHTSTRRQVTEFASTLARRAPGRWRRSPLHRCIIEYHRGTWTWEQAMQGAACEYAQRQFTTQNSIKETNNE